MAGAAIAAQTKAATAALRAVRAVKRMETPLDA
jgi:hypothetical protein